MRPFVSKRRTPSGNRLAAPLLLLTLALPLLVGGYQSYRREQQNRSARPIARRALTLCSAFGDSCEMTGMPVLWDENRTGFGGSAKTRRLWSVECVSGGRGYALIFNGSTGELGAIFAQGRAAGTAFQERAIPPIVKPSQAVESSLHWIRQLELVPAGSKIALAETPLLLRHKDAWQALWNVRYPESRHPMRLKLLIDRYSGVPVLLVNSRALDRL